MSMTPQIPHLSFVQISLLRTRRRKHHPEISLAVVLGLFIGFAMAAMLFR